MTQEQGLLHEALEDMFIHAIPEMESEQPKKMENEAKRIYDFAFESFRAGFLYGIKSGFGALEKETETA